MSDFEFVFALFGLLLGLSLVEVLSGLARTIDARLRPAAGMRIGWLTPLLGTFVLLDLLSFWQAAWRTRESIAVSGHTLLAVMAFTGAYYLAAHLVFPRDAESEVNLDNHFFRVRGVVIGVLLTLLCCQMAWYATLPDMAPLLFRPWSLVFTGLLAMLMAGAMLVRGERWAKFVMLALVARYVIGYLIF